MAQRQAALFALAANQHLANAPDWSSFRISNARAVMDAAAAVAGSQASALLHALAPVLARGMQLLSEQQLDVSTLLRHEQGMSALFVLCSQWTTASAALLPQPNNERAFVSLAVQMTRTGMIKAYEQLCRTLARFLSSPAAHGAAAAAAFKRSSIPPLTVQLMLLLPHVVENWPGNRAVLNAAVAAAVPAVAELAMAALRKTSAQSTAAPGSSSSLCWHAIADAAAAVVVTALYVGSTPNTDGKLVFAPDPTARSSAVMQLMMAHLALAAQTIHQRQHGLAAAAAGSAGAAAQQQQQQQQVAAVPAYHQQLLDALGVAGTVDLPPQSSSSFVADTLRWTLSGIHAVRFQRPREGGGNSSSSSSGSSAAAGQQQQAAAAVDASLLAPLLFALLECCTLLLPADQATAVVCLTSMIELLSAGCLELDCIPESLARDLPRAMLQLLLPAIRAADAAAAAVAGAAPAAAAGTAGAAPAEAEGVAVYAARVLLALTNCVAATAKKQRGEDEWPADSTVRALAAAFLEQPQRWCAVIEAAFRSTPAQGVKCQLQISEQFDQLLLAVSYARSEGISLAAGEQQQVFALLISCLKAGAAANAALVAADDEAAALATTAMLLVIDMVRRACRLLLPGNGTAAAAAAAASPSSSLLALHLLGRCLVAAGRAMQQALGWNPTVMLMPLLADVAQQLPLLSPASVPQQVVQQLLEEQAALQQQLQALPDQPAEASAGLGQQLEAFGAAVCAQAPVVHCCNHHLCSDTSQRSELELVSGKSCVCGGCRAARYCSRECQVAHYKGWHKAVCKRLQQQQA